MSDPKLTTDDLFNLIGRLYAECQGRARNEGQLEARLAEREAAPIFPLAADQLSGVPDEGPLKKGKSGR